MKLFLIDNYKLNIYVLPNKVEDAFLIDYHSPSGIEETITLKAENNAWVIESTPDVSIYNYSQSISKEELKDGACYQIKFSDLNYHLLLFCMDTPIKYVDLDTSNREVITIGRDTNSDIIYDNAYTGYPHAIIRKNNNLYILDNNNSEENIVYVNNNRVNSTILTPGDVIFINGLKIIWMENFIRVNNPNNSLQTKLGQYKHDTFNNQYTPVKDTEKNMVLYNENSIFFHTPILKEHINETTINITPPPAKMTNEEPPTILTLGATIMMGVASSITGVLAIFNVTSNRANWASAITEIVICFAMILGCIFFPVLLDKYNKRAKKKKENKRQKRYKEYLENKRKEIKLAMENEQSILNYNNLNIEECKNTIAKRENKLWNREIRDDDFLEISLGHGDKEANIKINVSLEDFSLEDDNLRDEVLNIKNEKLFLKNVPITVSLAKNMILPIVVSNNYPLRENYINGIMLQLMTYYSAIDLKIIIMTNENNKNKWSYFKYLPYCYSKDGKEHYFATNEDEIKSVSYSLENVYKERYNLINNKSGEEEKAELPSQKIEFSNKDEMYKNFDEYYLIVTDDYLTAKRSAIVDAITKNDENIGFSILMIEPTMKNVPSKSNNFVEINANDAHIFNKNITDNNNQKFIPEVLKENIRPYANVIANIPVSIANSKNSIPDSINFLEMYKVGKVDQLNVLNRWSKNDPTTSITAPVGIGEDGKLFEIDLHEKYHGPHGLVAGATGSGKSEFIITYILSMAINYDPREVQFVLIDYKGGGLAGAFHNKEAHIKLPHLVGTITNLDSNEMNRSLVSIQSELKRRQRKFNEARDKLNESTIDIYKYQKFYREGKVDEPIAHLFIISDEFAELKSQQPDFMDQLVSTARIGRSLGVHLILATQKPSGVVDDQIWSNARFKVCLKVQTAEDSREMLKRPEAASIKETGRFYLQVGYDELFLLGQSAWAGAKYTPTDRIVKSLNDEIKFIDNTGITIREINDVSKVDENENYGDQLTNIVKYLNTIGLREHLVTTDLWLPSIPAEIYLSEIIKKYNYKYNTSQIEAIIGELDDPERQSQDILTVNFNTTGHMAIVGATGSGKENLLMTIIYSICMAHSSEDVNFYIMDFGAEVLKVFKNMPHVGELIQINDKEKIRNLFVFLERELARRKELFSEFGGSYDSYIKNSGKKIPMLMIILNGYENFMEQHASYDDSLTVLIREASKYGIILIETAIQTNSIRNSIFQLFQNKFVLQIADPFDYKMLLEAPNGLVPAKHPGRGLFKRDNECFEFQTSYIYLKDQINDVIQKTIGQLTDDEKAKPIPMIPMNFTYDNVLSMITNFKELPIGINVHTAEIIKYDFITNKINLMIGNHVIDDCNNLIKDIMKMTSTMLKTKLRIIDLAGVVSEVEGDIDVFQGEFTATMKDIINYNNTDDNVIYLITGLGNMYDKVLDEGIEVINKILFNSDKLTNLNFIILDDYSTFRRLSKEAWYSKLDRKNGIWLGEGVVDQELFEINNLMTCDAAEEFKGVSYIIKDSNYELAKIIGTNHEEDVI